MLPLNFQQYFYYPLFHSLASQNYPMALPIESIWQSMTSTNSQTTSFPGTSNIEENQQPTPPQSSSEQSQVIGEETSRQNQKEKRRYRKRREWLEKKYRCNSRGCKCKYSSKIALNSHKRKKHPNGRRLSAQN